MWNGFKGDAGYPPLVLLAIPTVNILNFAYGQLQYFDYNLIKAFFSFAIAYPKLNELLYGIVYIIVCWTLYLYVPGSVEIGPINASGKRYPYKINSLNCMILLMALQVILCFFGILPLETLSLHYDRVIITFTWLGMGAAIFFYLKGRFMPTFKTSDSQFRDSFLEDFFSGVELNPRFTNDSSHDLKLFTIGHMGMIIWQLINISHAAYGINRGSYEALIICLLQTIYVADWAIFERWYLYTIDMQHDRLGFYLGFGGFAYMPCIYTGYAFHASHTPANNSNLALFIFAAIYIGGQYLMRASNNQKENFRKDPEKLIWGKKPKCLNVIYKTEDGKVRKNTLLLSGFWGWGRHFNYVGDFLECFAASAICGFHTFGAHIYSIQLIIILITRAKRDDTRCSLKYGEDWKKYKELMPYTFVYGVI